MGRLQLNPKLSCRLFKATVSASLMYGCESRGFLRSHVHRYQVFVTQCVQGLTAQRTIKRVMIGSRWSLCMCSWAWEM